MLYNYHFNKKLKKNINSYSLEITIPNIYNNFHYKIYGNKGYYNYGKYSSINNTNLNNILTINIDKEQIIFINILQKEDEYYDFLNMKDEIKKKYKKNIKMNIQKKYNNTIFLNKIKNSEDDSSNESEDDSSDHDSKQSLEQNSSEHDSKQSLEDDLLND